ncbi:MAG: TIGR00297 family protein [Halorhabdus sp.]
MTSAVRRAGAFAAVAASAALMPVVDRVLDPALATIAGTAPFLLLAAAALRFVESGVVFELFARPGDRRDGRLYGLAGFSLAIAALGLLSFQFDMPVAVPVAAAFVLGAGNLATHAARAIGADPFGATAAFVTGGALAGVVGLLISDSLVGSGPPLPEMVFLVASASLLGALLRSVLFERDDPLVLISVGLLLWLFSDLSISVTARGIAVALAITIALGYVSYALETASLPGMLTGVLLSLLTIVVGDYGWFAVLITFFGGGGLASKFRYDEKVTRGIAQENDGARGSGNVLANSLVALIAVLAAAASPQLTGRSPEVFLFVFAGSVAAAMSDTLSSEFGGLYDAPRLITTFERVEPGTDGAITWQGELAGIAGAAIIAGLAFGVFGTVGVAGAVVIVFSGIVGMTVDSLLGATLEGTWLSNQSVNFFATLAAGLLGGVLALGVAVP